MSIGGTTFGCTVHLATRHRLVTVTRDWRSESLIMSSDVLTLARQSNFNCQLLPKIVTSEEAHCQGQSEQHTERSSAPYKICQKLLPFQNLKNVGRSQLYTAKYQFYLAQFLQEPLVYQQYFSFTNELRSWFSIFNLKQKNKRKSLTRYINL